MQAHLPPKLKVLADSYYEQLMKQHRAEKIRVLKEFRLWQTTKKILKQEARLWR